MPLLALLTGLLIFALGISGSPSSMAADQELPPRCANGGDHGSTLQVDTTWDQDVYLAQNLTVRASSALTITPGVTVYFCGDYNLNIGALFNPGRLHAVGTAQAPITFQPVDGGVNWGHLHFGDSVAEPSMLQQAILRRGGGNDPTATTQAALYVSDRHAPVGQVSPLIHQVRVEESGAHGVRVQMDNQNDPLPPSLTALTVTGSQLAPFYVEAAAVSGLGEGISASNNGVNHIQVQGDNLNGGMFFDQTWRNHGIPYEILGSLYIRNSDANKLYATWRIEPGVHLLIHENRTITVGSLYGDARLLAQGSADAPIVFERFDGQSSNWGSIQFDAWSVADSRLQWVELRHGGGAPAANSGTLIKRGSGALTLEHVTISQGSNAGLEANAGKIQVHHSLFEQNQVGINLRGAGGQIQASRFTDNPGGAVRNTSPSQVCVDAAGNWWGSADGPLDSSGAANDRCAPGGRTHAGSGGSVSDGVIYWPWLGNASGVPTDQSSISPGLKYWIVADGLDAGALTVTLLDGAGQPLPGKEIRLESSLGVLSQPTQPTDAFGQTTAAISSTVTGEATITGLNVTDQRPLESRAAVVFWQGGPDTGGLVSPSGVPYARPELLIEGEPFQVGFPVIFRLPMQNARATPVDVSVTYQVSNFGIGQRWTPVTAISQTLAPGGFWDAPGGFVSPDTAHRCMRYELIFNYADGVSRSLLAGGSTSGSSNIKNSTPPASPPPDDCRPDVMKLIPRDISGVKGVNKHAKNMNQQMGKVSCFLDTNLRRAAVESTGQRDYETIYTPPTFVGQALAPGVDVTQAQADAATAMSQATAHLLALDLGIRVTYERMQGASQAQAWSAALAQSNAFQEFQRQRAAGLDALADAAAALRAANIAAGEDETYTPQAYARYLDDLKANGFDAETRSFHRATGLTDAQINDILATEIAGLEAGIPQTTTSLNGILDSLVAQSREEAATLRSFFPAARAGQADGLIRVAPVTLSFVVGNPSPITDTVRLTVRPIDLPLQWQASLDRTQIKLGPGEEIQVNLLLNPGVNGVAQSKEIQVAVEGTINGELIGGVLLRHRTPGPAASQVFLPSVER